MPACPPARMPKAEPNLIPDGQRFLPRRLGNWLGAQVLLGNGPAEPLALHLQCGSDELSLMMQFVLSYQGDVSGFANQTVYGRPVSAGDSLMLLHVLRWRLMFFRLVAFVHTETSYAHRELGPLAFVTWQTASLCRYSS